MVRAVTPIPFVKARFFDRCGKPLADGKVHTYEANTTTPKVTYKDPYGLTPNTNPIILDAAGEADIYLDGTYRIRITDRNDVLINDVAKIGSWFSDNLQDTLDNISGAMNDAIKPVLQNLYDAINTAAAAGAGANGWIAWLVADESGLTQQQINNNLSGLDSIADMLGIVEPKNGQRVNVKGVRGGTFEWQADSTDAADNGITFAVSGVATGRWVRTNFEIVYPEMFGALGDGVTDDSAALKAMFKAAITYNKLWFIPKKTYFINGTSSIDISTSGESQAKFLLPKNNAACCFKIVRDSDNVEQTIDTSAWTNLVRGRQDINAINVTDKIVYISSNEVAAVRMGYNYSYTKQERLRIDATGQATTPLVYTYDNPSQIVVKAFNKSNPITIVGLNVEWVGNGTGEKGAIIVERDAVTLNNPIVLNQDTSIPVKAAISLSYCADTIINRPVINNINFDGAGYGIIATGTIGVVVNDPQIDNCRHAFSGAYNVDVTVNRGTTTVIDDHWGARMVIDGTKIKSVNGNSECAVLYAGSDINIRNVTHVGGTTLLGITTATSILTGRVVIDNVTINATSTAVGYYYIFGMSSTATINATSDVMTVDPSLPDYVSISNVGITANSGKFVSVYRLPIINLTYKDIGELFARDIKSNVALAGVLVYNSGFAKKTTSKITLENIDFVGGTSLYLTATASGMASTSKLNIVLKNTQNGSLRLNPNMINSVTVQGGSNGSIRIENGDAWTASSAVVGQNVTMTGGSVNANIAGAAFFNCMFTGAYTAFPAAANVTLIGCAKTVAQPALPTNITSNISAPYIA